jgi:hypothetical protein
MNDEEVISAEEALENAVVMTVRKFFWNGFKLGVVFTLVIVGACRWMEML